MSSERAPLPAPVRRRLFVALAAAVALTAVAAVAIVEAAHYAHDSPTAASSSLPAIDSRGFTTVEARSAPAFSLPELARPSVTVSSASLFDRPTIVNLWSSTCTICEQESPAMARAYRLLGSKVRFVGIDTADVSRSAGLAFARRYGLGYELLSDPTATLAAEFGTTGLPTTYFVSGSGKIEAVNLGAITVAGLERDVQKVFHVTLPPGAGATQPGTSAAT